MSFWTGIRKGVLGVAAVAAAPYTGGASLALLAATQGASRPSAAGGGMAVGNQFMPNGYGGPMPGGGGGGGMVQTAGVIPPAMRALSAVGRYLISARGIASTLTGKLVGVFKGTKLIPLKTIADLAKRVGIDATAAALGVTAVEVAQLIAAHLMQSSSRRKRGRGISARDVRTTRRTIHKIRSIEHAIAGVARRPAARSRTRSAPAAFIRQG